APGRSFAAIPDLVSPSVDRESRTVRIRYRIDNADMVLRDGMIAVAKVELRRHEGVVVPSHVLVMEPAIDDSRVSYRVFLAVGLTARRVEARVGIVEGAWAGVFEGVSEGDRVIVDGRHMVSDGAAIDVVGEATELSPPP
ncbi:MAG: efflux RND transporter periplasmic adaptor subunit, partial [Myxococcota bacterium]|nr:efflux RND transporter periplasmic adaptor subunit [Myxococcota bacterium]